MRRAACTAVALAGLATTLPVVHSAADAEAATCISADRSFGCPRGRGMENPFSLTLSPDGRTLYVPSDNEATAAVLSLNRRTGAIRQSRRRDGCLAGRRVSKPDGPFGVRYAHTCTRVRGIAAAVKGLAASRDGRNVYVVSGPDESSGGLQAVATLTRRANGTFRQRAGRSGCAATKPLDGCSVIPTLRAAEITLSADGRHAYLAGSSTVTVMERDRRSGALTWRSCLASGAVTGCERLPPGMTELGAPAFSPDQRTGYLVSSRYSEARDQSIALLTALTRDPGSGALSARAPGGCLASAPLRDCAVDARLDETLSAPVFSPDGRDAYVTSGPVSYDVPLDSDVPFALAGLRHDPPTGSLSAVGAFCLSRLDRAGCVRDRRVWGLFELAISPDGTQVYATRGPDIATFERDPQTGALRLIGLLRGCPDFGRCRAEAPIDNPTHIVVAPGGRHVFVASNSEYGTGTVATLATR